MSLGRMKHHAIVNVYGQTILDINLFFVKKSNWKKISFSDTIISNYTFPRWDVLSHILQYCITNNNNPTGSFRSLKDIFQYKNTVFLLLAQVSKLVTIFSMNSQQTCNFCQNIWTRINLRKTQLLVCLRNPKISCSVLHYCNLPATTFKPNLCKGLFCERTMGN